MVRISVMVDGQEVFLRLDEDISNEFERINNAFELDEISGEYSLGLKVAVDGNAVALGQAHHVELEEGERLIDCKYYVDDHFSSEAKLLLEESYTDLVEGFYDCSLILTTYYAEIEDVTLRECLNEEVDLGFFSDEIAASMRTITNQEYPEAKFCFPTLYNPKAYNDRTEISRFEGWINFFNEENDQYVINEFFCEFAISPQVYLLHALRMCFEHLNWRIDGDEIFNNEFLKKRLIVGNRLLDRFDAVSNARFQANTNQQFIPSGDGLVLWEEILFSSSDDITNSVPSYFPYHAVQGDYTVRVTLYIVDDNAGGYEPFDILTYDGQGIAAAVPHAPGVIEVESQVTFGSVTEMGIVIEPAIGYDVEIFAAHLEVVSASSPGLNNRWEGDFNIGECVPNISVGDFLKLVKARYNIAIYPKGDERTVYLRFADGYEKDFGERTLPEARGVRKIFKRSIKLNAHFSNDSYEPNSGLEYVGAFPAEPEYQFPVAGENQWLVETMTNHVFVSERNDLGLLEWVDKGLHLEEVVLGEGKEKIDLDLGELVDMGRITHEDFGTYLVPVMDEVGWSTTFSDFEEDWDLRFLIFQEFIINSEFVHYPFASSFRYSGDSELLQDEGFGIWDRFHQRRYDMLKADEYEVSVLVPKQYLNAFFHWQTLHFRNREWLVERMIVKESDQEELTVIRLVKK